MSKANQKVRAAANGAVVKASIEAPHLKALELAKGDIAEARKILHRSALQQMGTIMDNTRREMSRLAMDMEQSHLQILAGFNNGMKGLDEMDKKPKVVLKSR